jgi:hypothetical protein
MFIDQQMIIALTLTDTRHHSHNVTVICFSTQSREVSNNKSTLIILTLLSEIHKFQYVHVSSCHVKALAHPDC